MSQCIIPCAFPFRFRMHVFCRDPSFRWGVNESVPRACLHSCIFRKKVTKEGTKDKSLALTCHYHCILFIGQQKILHQPLTWSHAIYYWTGAEPRANDQNLNRLPDFVALHKALALILSETRIQFCNFGKWKTCFFYCSPEVNTGSWFCKDRCIRQVIHPKLHKRWGSPRWTQQMNRLIMLITETSSSCKYLSRSCLVKFVEKLQWQADKNLRNELWMPFKWVFQITFKSFVLEQNQFHNMILYFIHIHTNSLGYVSFPFTFTFTHRGGVQTAKITQDRLEEGQSLH